MAKTGFCAGVSPGGYFAGGGFGTLTPALGLGVDNVLEIKVVLADGRVATCTHNKTVIEDDGSVETRYDGELFWALRGGGGGTFGVVVHYVIKLHPTQSGYVVGLLRVSLNLNESDKVIRKKHIDSFLDWAGTVPPYWGGSVELSSDNINTVFTKLGPWDSNTESEISPFLDLQSRYKEQINSSIVNMTSARFVYGTDRVYSVRTYTTGALVQSKENNATGLWDFLIRALMDFHARNTRVKCNMVRLGGKVAEYDVRSSSVHAGFRRAQFSLWCSFVAPNNHKLSSIEEQERLVPLVAQFSERLRYFQDGQYINTGYVASPNWKLDFWGDHYVDLLKVKIRYDPDNFFTCYHCVGSDRINFEESTSATGKELSLHLLAVVFAVLILMF